MRTYFSISAIAVLTLLPGFAEAQPKPTNTEGPFVTKEPVNGGGGAKAQCSPGYYVTAIQITKDPDPTQQRAINVWCTKPQPRSR
jgi:hypothetical protein